MTHAEHVEDIMNNLDFVKIRDAMVALDWTWMQSLGNVPDVEHLRDMARKLLNTVDQDCPSASCGGFTAECFENGSLSLYFAIDSWTTEGENKGNVTF